MNWTSKAQKYLKSLVFQKWHRVSLWPHQEPVWQVSSEGREQWPNVDAARHSGSAVQLVPCMSNSALYEVELKVLTFGVKTIRHAPNKFAIGLSSSVFNFFPCSILISERYVRSDRTSKQHWVLRNDTNYLTPGCGGKFSNICGLIWESSILPFAKKIKPFPS